MVFILLNSLSKLYICEFCLKYLKTQSLLQRHMVRAMGTAFYYKLWICLAYYPKEVHLLQFCESWQQLK